MDVLTLPSGQSLGSEPGVPPHSPQRNWVEKGEKKWLNEPNTDYQVPKWQSNLAI